MQNTWGNVNGIRPVKIARRAIENGVSVQDFEKYFETDLGVSEEKTKLTLDIALREIEVLKDVDRNDISIYIGVPFCKTRCLYCSFVTNSVGVNNKYMADFVNCLLKEIDFTAELIKKTPYRIIGLYFGGGTPTTLSAVDLKTVIERCYERFDLRFLKEFTVEAGRPDTIDEEKLRTLIGCGVTRISINPQSMNDRILKLIGRGHTVSQIYESFALARKIGFSNINTDLIAGLPTETFDEFCHSVDSVINNLEPESVTVHTMSIKRGSRLHECLGDYALTDGEIVGNMVDYALEKLKERDFNPYYLYRQKQMVGNFENIGYSKKGFENLYNIMIMEETNSIVSLGCGGVTKIVNLPNDKIERVFNVKEAVDYVTRIDEMCQRKNAVLEWLK